jgi:hypothetical protein
MQLGELLKLAHIGKQIPVLRTVVVDKRHRRRWRTRAGHRASSFSGGQTCSLPHSDRRGYFRATQADAKIRREGASGKDEANEIHREAGRVVRRAIAELGGTMPENLPTPSESVQQLRRREEKRLQSGPSLWDEEEQSDQPAH